MSSDYPTLRAEVALLARDVPVETTVSEHCPACKSKERKLSLTRAHNGALFICHRASCAFRGFVSMDGTGAPKDTIPKYRPKPARPFTRSSSALTLKDALTVLRGYPGFHGLALPTDLHKWGMREFLDEGWLFECRGLSGELLGHITRAPDKTIRTYRSRDGVDMYSYYAPMSRMFNPGGLFIVEDCISAMCIASHGYNALALLGTNMTTTVRGAIVANGVRAIVFLDPDAIETSLAIAKRLPGSKVILGHTKDPKDIANLGEILREYA